MGDPELFSVEPVVRAPEEKEKLSGDRRRTLRQRADVERGVHPLTRGRARPDLGTCGDCRHRVLEYAYNGHKSWPKCELGPRSAGPATDVRRWWPSCDRFEPKE
jgi:hypothetical protein